MNYTLDDFMSIEKLFRFRFDNGIWVGVDLAENYPNYEVPLNSGTSEFTHMTCLQDETVRTFKTNDIRKRCTIIKFYEYNGKMYKKTTQTEYDKFKFQTEPESDNGRVFNLLESLYSKNRKVKVTVI